MGDLIKWALLGVLIITIFAILLSTGLFGEIGTALTNNETFVSVIEFTNSASSYISQGRQLLNNFVNPYVLNVGLFFTFFGWFIQWSLVAIVSVCKFIFK